MQLKQVPAKLFYCAAKELTKPEIPEFAEQSLEKLYKSAESLQVLKGEPPEFLYFHGSDDPQQPMYLVIGIPASSHCPPEDDFFFMETLPFNCISVDYKGAMSGISQAWVDLVEKVLAEGYLLSNQGREIYREWISFESEDNLTELQTGVGAKRIK